MAYDNDTYLRSLAGARESITRQVENTVAEVNRQQQLGIDQSKLLPGAVDASNASMRQVTGATADRMQGGINRLGDLAPALAGTVDGVRGAVEQRLATVRDAWGRAAPLVGQGFEERGAQQRGRVSLIGQQLYADNDMARSNYVSGREAEDRQRAHDQEQAAQQREFDLWAIGEQARQQRESLAAQAAESQKNRDFQQEQTRLDRLAGALGVNPLQPQPLSQVVNQMFRNYGGLPPESSVSDIALLTGTSPEVVQRELNKYKPSSWPVGLGLGGI